MTETEFPRGGWVEQKHGYDYAFRLWAKRMIQQGLCPYCSKRRVDVKRHIEVKHPDELEASS